MDHRVTEPSASRGLVPEEGLEPSWPQGPRDFESRASTNSATPAIPRSHHRTGARKDSLLTARGESTPGRVHDRKRAKSQVFGCGCFPPRDGGANRSAMHPTVLGKSLPTRRRRRCAPQFDAARLAPSAADNPSSQASSTLKETSRGPSFVPLTRQRATTGFREPTPASRRSHQITRVPAVSVFPSVVPSAVRIPNMLSGRRR